MSESEVSIRFDGNGRAYQPGETLSGECRLEAVPADALKAIELSVLWYTEGKGDEDLAVHDFQRIAADGGQPLDPQRPIHFSTTLPNSPLSYDGQIVKVRWCVRVRVFLTHGRRLFGQHVFRLGNIPPAKAVDIPPAKAIEP
jgi:hypothetical protein